MYENFIAANIPVRERSVSDSDLAGKSYNDQLISLFKECGGCSMHNGLYKIYDLTIGKKWMQTIGLHYPTYKHAIFPFGADWLGRQYAIDRANGDRLWMFDPATGGAYSLDTDLETFHNYDLVLEVEETLSVSYFKSILKQVCIESISYEDCLGYSVPLFLGGKDTPANFKKSNMEVYFELQLQIYAQVKDLPPGTEINLVNFKPR